MLWIAIIILITAADQVSKYIVIKSVETGQLIPVINNFFYITYHENAGAAWGILQNKRYIFIFLTIVISIVMIYVLFKTKDKMLKLALSFVLGGAMGNLIDRIIKGSVADFLDFYFGKYNFPTFNVADSFVVIGTIILAVYLLFYYEETEIIKL
ncbi:MAG TPA: signal peptidase II [Clostridiales bacterium]|nr:signal peptidase II [Clostridiales bacterium]